MVEADDDAIDLHDLQAQIDLSMPLYKILSRPGSSLHTTHGLTGKEHWRMK